MVLVSTLIGVAAGFLLSFFGTWLRDRWQAKAERGLLAAALAAELRGVQKLVDDVLGQRSSTWSVEGQYFRMYNSAGHRMSLLKRDVLQEVVTCYCAVKKSVDMLRRWQRLVDHERTRSDQGRPLQEPLRDAEKDARSAHASAAEGVKALLPRLDKLAGGGAQ